MLECTVCRSRKAVDQSLPRCRSSIPQQGRRFESLFRQRPVRDSSTRLDLIRPYCLISPIYRLRGSLAEASIRSPLLGLLLALAEEIQKILPVTGENNAWHP